MLGIPLAEPPFQRMAITGEPSHFIRANDQLVAPPLLPVEISTIIRQRMRSEQLDLTEASDLLRDL